MLGMCPDGVAFPFVLRSYCCVSDARIGARVHGHVVKLGFDSGDVVGSSLVEMYGNHGGSENEGEVLDEMPLCIFDSVTVVNLLRSSVDLNSLKVGKAVHCVAVVTNLCEDLSVNTALLSMYAKLGDLEGAELVFDEMPEWDCVVWNIMISAYSRNGQPKGSLELLRFMEDQGSTGECKILHGYSMKLGLNSLSTVNTAFLVSYAKCGCIEMARKLFDEENINDKDLITWNSMIGAYAKHGDWYLSFKLYNQMKDLSMKPDQVTFLGLLTACVNAGLVQEGKKCFEEMIEKYGYQPSQEHYACMADLLGRAGHLEKWDKVAEIRRLLRDMGLKKTPGCSWVEINGRRHEFRVADRTHPKSDGIYAMLRNLELESKDAKMQINV
ncbi:hypothetical protein M0R45_013647 [Rubus argutus]|uniref:Pentatricopeptide repeat-containing protein n=1 Tax=Rubus argutus TaxID=59490 RepID=A0AAW1XL45_RUBAR